MGIKVLVDPNRSEDQILQLQHEEQVSRLLLDGCRCRRVVDVRSFRGDPAVHFVWAEGSSLAEWLRDVRNTERAERPGNDHVVKVRLKVATAIVETLVQFHNNGVVYNNLLQSNIVLEEVDGSYVATFVDLSEALVFHQKDKEFARLAGEIDLKYLGAVLHELFCTNEISSDTNDEEEEKKKGEAQSTGESAEEGKGNIEGGTDEQRKRGRQQPVGAGDGLPMYLGTVISTLLLTKEDGAATPCQSFYETASDVLNDLREAERYPGVYLRPPVVDDSLARSRLELPADPFWGRRTELSMLLQAFDSATKSGGRSIMVSISGGPGTG